MTVRTYTERGAKKVVAVGRAELLQRERIHGTGFQMEK